MDYELKRLLPFTCKVREREGEVEGERGRGRGRGRGEGGGGWGEGCENREGKCKIRQGGCSGNQE